MARTRRAISVTMARTRRAISVFGRDTVGLVDHQHVDLALDLRQLQSKLLLDGCRQVRAGIAGAIAWTCGADRSSLNVEIVFADQTGLIDNRMAKLVSESPRQLDRK